LWLVLASRCVLLTQQIPNMLVPDEMTIDRMMRWGHDLIQ
jgi:hypothetical protein